MIDPEMQRAIEVANKAEQQEHSEVMRQEVQ